MSISLYCCGCQANITPRLTDGEEIYKHRKDLYSLPFWKCDTCFNFVGCHHQTKDRTKPLGCIPTKEIKKIRSKLHEAFDPLWKNNNISRSGLYKKVGDAIGYEYHAASVQSVEEGEKILSVIHNLKLN
jgi:cobyric acid synthase